MKEIIIDGVDISECVELYELDEMVCIADGNEVSCKGKNCYYKQLQRLKQENKKLQKIIQDLEELSLKTYDVADFQMYFDKLNGKEEL